MLPCRILDTEQFCVVFLDARVSQVSSRDRRNDRDLIAKEFCAEYDHRYCVGRCRNSVINRFESGFQVCKSKGDERTCMRQDAVLLNGTEFQATEYVQLTTSQGTEQIAMVVT